MQVSHEAPFTRPGLRSLETFATVPNHMGHVSSLAGQMSPHTKQGSRIVNDSSRRRGLFHEINFKQREKQMNKAMQFVLRALLMAGVFFTVSAVAQDAHNTGTFQGPKANKGHVTHSNRDGKSVLTLSDDFVVPDTPDPHWQVVDSDGQVYLLDKLKKKALLGDKFQKEIVLPGYVKNVSKVIIWCAWAEANLGEASFSSPVK